MPMLDAALAFAITMLAVASVVTAIVGKIAASESYRRDTFKAQLQSFYAAHVKDVVSEKLSMAEKEADERANKAVAELMAKMQLDGSVELSTKELLGGLSRTELGKDLQAKVAGEAQEIAERLAAGWEQIGQEFSAKFRAKARTWSYVTGIVVAAVINIDSVYIIETYLTDDQALAEVLGQQDAMLTQYAAFLNSPTAQASGAGDPSVVTEAQRDIEEIRADIDALKGSGIPLGWDRAPWAACTNGVRWVPRCPTLATGDPFTGWDRLGVIALWIFGVLLTGYLAGLGAPFWYDLVSGISHLAQVKRGSQQRTAQAGGVGAPGGGKGGGTVTGAGLAPAGAPAGGSSAG